MFANQHQRDVYSTQKLQYKEEKNTQVGWEEQKVNKRKGETTKDNGYHYLPLHQARNSLPKSHLIEQFSMQNMKTHGPENLIFNNLSQTFKPRMTYK